MWLWDIKEKRWWSQFNQELLKKAQIWIFVWFCSINKVNRWEEKSQKLKKKVNILRAYFYVQLWEALFQWIFMFIYWRGALKKQPQALSQKVNNNQNDCFKNI